MTSTALEELEGFVRHKVVVEKASHKQLNRELQEAFPGRKGLSISSVDKFCAERKIRKITDIDEQHLDDAVSQAVSQVNA